MLDERAQGEVQHFDKPVIVPPAVQATAKQWRYGIYVFIPFLYFSPFPNFFFGP